MSSCKRLIARLDVKGKRLIKGIRFEGLRVIGDACNSAREYAINGIDEIFYTDAVASLYGRNGLIEVLRDTTKEVFVPITAGGAIRSVEDGRRLLSAGADKLAINSAAVKDPSLINKLSKKFGSQCIVLSIQACHSPYSSNWDVMIESGRERSNKNLKEWIKEAQDRGVGEIFITSVDKDGTGNGPDMELIDNLIHLVKVPIVFGGGFSSSKQIANVFRKHSQVSGISIGWGLHYNHVNLLEAKEEIKKINLPIRSINCKIDLNKIKENIEVSVIDYGMGNLQSLKNAFNLLGFNCLLINEPAQIEDSKICVLPGVGAFPEGMKQLRNYNLIEKINNYSSSGGCLIGVCLGMQLLFQKGMEYEECEGLGLIRGLIEKLPQKTTDGKDIILPHVGWNKIISSENSNFEWKEDLKNIDQYFVHSFAAMYNDEIKKNVVYTTKISEYKFASMIRSKNTVGMQFHPERSGEDGINLLSNVIHSLISKRI